MQTTLLDIKKIQTMILEMLSNRERKIPRRRRKKHVYKRILKQKWNIITKPINKPEKHKRKRKLVDSRNT